MCTELKKMYIYCKYFGLLKDLVGKAILPLQYMHVIMKNYRPGIHSRSDMITYDSKY